jgi:hypothetical protein
MGVRVQMDRVWRRAARWIVEVTRSASEGMGFVLPGMDRDARLVRNQEAVLRILAVGFASLGRFVMDVIRNRMSSKSLAAVRLIPRSVMLIWKLTVDEIKGLSKPFAQVVGTGMESDQAGPSSCQQRSVSEPQEISKSVLKPPC